LAPIEHERSGCWAGDHGNWARPPQRGNRRHQM
jgi:hypothetical protein